MTMRKANRKFRVTVTIHEVIEVDHNGGMGKEEAIINVGSASATTLISAREADDAFDSGSAHEFYSFILGPMRAAAGGALNGLRTVLGQRFRKV